MLPAAGGLDGRSQIGEISTITPPMFGETSTCSEDIQEGAAKVGFSNAYREESWFFSVRSIAHARGHSIRSGNNGLPGQCDGGCWTNRPIFSPGD